MNYLSEMKISCPYCGEFMDILIEKIEEDQQYIEDCQVCCKPMVINVSRDEFIEVLTEDEANWS